MTTTSPPRTANSVMCAAPDGPANEKVLLFSTGNYPSYSTFLNETWVFNGSTLNWVDLSTSLINANGPLPGRINSVMSYDGYNVMLFGGQGGSSTTGVLDDMWLWNGTTWSLFSGTVPFGRYNSKAAYLVGTGVVMFGGQNLLYNLLETQIWNGNTQTWSLLPVANGTGPGARTGHMMAANTTEVLLFGGQGTNNQLNSTWTFASSTWTKQAPTTVPSVRSGGTMCYDGYGSVFVMFGGHNEYNYLNETWTYNSGTNNWTFQPQANGVGPAGLIGAQMCFDTISNRTILFGGVSATTNYPSNQTWSYNSVSNVLTQL